MVTLMQPQHEDDGEDDEEVLDRLLDPRETAVEVAPSLEDKVFQTLDYHALARDLARKIHLPATLLRRYGLTKPQLMLLCVHAPFKKIVAVERAVWEDTDNAGERAKQYHREGQAEAASEIVGMILDNRLPAAVRLDAAKLSAKIAGIDIPPKDPQQPSWAAGAGGFAINIHLGDGKVERISSAGPTNGPVIEGEIDGIAE